MTEFNVNVKISELEKLSGKSLVSSIAQVPFGNVLTAFRVIPMLELVKMVKNVELPTLVEGLKIITPKQIEEVSIDKLQAVLYSSNMELVADLQSRFLENEIIHALNKLPVFWIRATLAKNDLDFAISVVNNALHGEPEIDMTLFNDVISD